MTRLVCLAVNGTDPVRGVAAGTSPGAEHNGVWLVVCAVLIAAWIAGVVVRRVVWRRWVEGSRVLTILPPARLDSATTIAGAQRLWWDLPSLAPPRWKRLLTGIPHLGLEYHLSAEAGLEVRLWLPGPVSTSRIATALQAAWPGTLIVDQTEPHPGGPGSRSPASTAGMVTGGRVRLQRPEYLPLHIPDPREDTTDPVRALEAVASHLRTGESAVVQILARPAVGRRLRRYRRTVDRLHSGQPAHRSRLASTLLLVARAVLHLGSSTTAAQNRDVRRDPQTSDRLRDIRAKKRQPQWDVVLRYYAATTERGLQARKRVRGIADSLFGMFALLAGHNAFVRRRLTAPQQVVAARRWGGGALLSAHELAALAHLPTRTDALVGGRARSVPAPPHTTRHL